MGSTFKVIGMDRSLEVKCDPIEKMVTIVETLDEELETVSMTFDEAYRAFNLILDSINITAVS